MNRRNTYIALVLIVFLTAPVGSVQAAPLTKGDVVARLVEAYGGEANLRKLDAAEQLWRLKTHVGRGDGHDFRRVLLPNHLLVELTYPSRTERRLLTEGHAYNSFGGSALRPATQPQRDAMRLQLLRLYSPLALRERLAALELRDEEDLCVLSLIVDDVRADYLIDKRDWHITKVAGTLQVNGMEMQFLTEYSDFRMVDGVLVHHRENKFAGDVNTATLELLNIRSGLELSPDDFAVSEGI